MSVLKAENLTKKVTSPEGMLTIVNDVSLDIAAGESVAIVGASGAGKSTLLALLASQVVSGFANDDDVVKRRPPVAVALIGKRSGWGGTLSRLRSKIALF